MCDRGHSKWHYVSRIIKGGVLKKHCDFILGCKMNEGVGSRVIECGDLPLGSKLPEGYLAMSEFTL